MKRFAIAVVALSSVSLAFAGCKKDKEEGNKNAESTEETTAPKAVEGDTPVEESDKAQPAAAADDLANEAEEAAEGEEALEGAEGEEAAEGDEAAIGVPECDDLIAKYSACVSEKAPEDAREKTLADFNANVEAWKKDAADESKKAELAQGCTAQAEALKKSTEAWGCEW